LRVVFRRFQGRRHHEGNEERRAGQIEQPIERVRHDTDHLEVDPVEPYSPADDRRIRGEVAPPDVLTDDDNRVATGHLVLFGPETAAKKGYHTEAGFSRLTAQQAIVAYDQSLVVVDTLLRRGNIDWNGLFRALGASSRTEYTFDNFGLRYAELEGEIESAIGTTAASRSR
jgi:hypothetical protein